MTWLLLISGLLMALIAGVFLSFSDFVMRGLAQAPETAGAAGMLGLNRTVYRSVFMVLLVGFLPGSVALALLALAQIEGAPLSFVIVGSLAYILGVFAVTGLGNVPMNNRLDSLSGRAGELATYWPEYVRRWTLLNHLRTATSGFAALSWLTAANML